MIEKSRLNSKYRNVLKPENIMFTFLSMILTSIPIWNWEITISLIRSHYIISSISLFILTWLFWENLNIFWVIPIRDTKYKRRVYTFKSRENINLFLSQVASTSLFFLSLFISQNNNFKLIIFIFPIISSTTLYIWFETSKGPTKEKYIFPSHSRSEWTISNEIIDYFQKISKNNEWYFKLEIHDKTAHFKIFEVYNISMKKFLKDGFIEDIEDFLSKEKKYTESPKSCSLLEFQNNEYIFKDIRNTLVKYDKEKQK